MLTNYSTPAGWLLRQKIIPLRANGTEMVMGDNIHPTISTDNKDEITRLFNELKEGGEVYAELGRTFFSEWYGMVKDKFGITWHILHYTRPE